MLILFLIGRLLFGGYFLYSGIKHFTNHQELTIYTEGKRIPWPGLAVYTSGIFMILGGLGIILGAYPVVSGGLIALFLIIATIRMHNFWQIDDPVKWQTEWIHFAKNAALLGTALILMALPTPWPYSIFAW